MRHIALFLDNLGISGDSSVLLCASSMQPVKMSLLSAAESFYFPVFNLNIAVNLAINRNDFLLPLCVP